MMISITDKAGTSGTVTVEKDDAERSITPWFPEAPEDVRKALFDLQTALDRGEATSEIETFLGIAIER